MREKAGLTKTELVERLGAKPQVINRLEGYPLGQTYAYWNAMLLLAELNY